MHQACLRACVFLLADMAKPNDSERLCLELSCAVNEQRTYTLRLFEGVRPFLCQFYLEYLDYYWKTPNEDRVITGEHMKRLKESLVHFIPAQDNYSSYRNHFCVKSRELINTCDNLLGAKNNDSRISLGASAFLRGVDFRAFEVNVKTIAPKKYLYQSGHAIWWGRGSAHCEHFCGKPEF